MVVKQKPNATGGSDAGRTYQSWHRRRIEQGKASLLYNINRGRRDTARVSEALSNGVKAGRVGMLECRLPENDSGRVWDGCIWQLASQGHYRVLLC